MLPCACQVSHEFGYVSRAHSEPQYCLRKFTSFHVQRYSILSHRDIQRQTFLAINSRFTCGYSERISGSLQDDISFQMSLEIIKILIIFRPRCKEEQGMVD